MPRRQRRTQEGMALNPFYKNLALWLVITLMMVMLYNLFSQQHLSESTLNYSQFLSMVNEDRVAEVVHPGQGALRHGRQPRPLQGLRPAGPGADRPAAAEARRHQRQARERVALVHVAAGVLVPDAGADRGLGLLHAPDAVRRRQGACPSARAARG
ncbi:MAG: hypothetical protein MZU91_07655 [Desulfosudis oleivorans]|nr:hypothetical protein [Desulfosudis oleivorans]